MKKSEIENNLSFKISTSTNDLTALYSQAVIDQNKNYLEGHLTIYKEAFKILNENIEMKNVSFISLVNKLKEKVDQSKKELSAKLNEPIVCNRNIINLNGMKIKENKKRVYEDCGEKLRMNGFEEEKSSQVEGEFVLNNNPLLPQTFKKIKEI